MRRLLPILLVTLAACSQPALLSSAENAGEEPGTPQTAALAGDTPTNEETQPPMTNDAETSPDVNAEPAFEVVKTDEEWREQLSPEAYYVTRQAGTERPGSGKYEHETTAGTYRCICCENPLFRSDAKFDSGCGWPAFFEPLEGANLIELEDRSHGMVRTEIRCGKCDAHLGHVFFGERHAPGGVRYCINSVALNLEPDGESPQ